MDPFEKKVKQYELFSYIINNYYRKKNFMKKSGMYNSNEYIEILQLIDNLELFRKSIVDEIIDLNIFYKNNITYYKFLQIEQLNKDIICESYLYDNAYILHLYPAKCDFYQEKWTKIHTKLSTV